MVIGEITLDKNQVDTNTQTTDLKISSILSQFDTEILSSSFVAPAIGEVIIDAPIDIEAYLGRLTTLPATDMPLDPLEALYQASNQHLEAIEDDIRQLQATANTSRRRSAIHLLRLAAPNINWGIDTI